MYAGLVGSGNDTELKIIRETEKAYLLLTDEDQKIWMPKSAFDDDGTLLEGFHKMYMSKITGED